MTVKLEKITDERPGFIRKGWLEDIWTMPETSPDEHLDDMEILVDCE